MDNKKTNSYGYKGIFWGLTAGAIASLTVSAYCLYNYLFGDEELADEEVNQIENIKHEMEEELQESGGSGGPLKVETALQILTMTNRVAEEAFKRDYPLLDDERRAVVDDPDAYEGLCSDTFAAKEKCYQEAMSKVMSKFGSNITMEDLHKVMQGKNPMELEKLTHKYDKQSFIGKQIPDKATSKEAFLFLGKKFQTEMREFQVTMSRIQNQNNPEQEQYMFFKMLMIKMKVDDIVYNKYKYTEQEIKYMLHEYNMFDDPEVRQVNLSMASFDQMFG